MTGRTLAAAALAWGFSAGGLAGQEPAHVVELRALREVASFEQAGDFERAEQRLRDILARNPRSLSALLSLERILAMNARSEEVLPFIDALLREDRTSPIGHQMRLRTLSALERLDALEAAGDEWIRRAPDNEMPYREIARIWRQRRDLTRALAVLERGLARIDLPDALALELGDVYADLDQPERAVQEWQRAIGPDGEGFLLVQRRLAGLHDGGAAALTGLISALADEPTTVARRRAAVTVAIEAGLRERAAELAQQVAQQLPAAEREAFLIDVARRADGAGLLRTARWAYDEAAALPGTAESRLALRTRAAELALAMGDTAQAAQAWAELEEQLAPGSAERRRALALRIGLQADGGDLDSALRDASEFRRNFADAAELDDVVGTVAHALLNAGRVDDAETLIAGVDGARSSLVRGRILLGRGETSRARTALLAAAHGLRGAEATETIALVTLLGRVGQTAGARVGRVVSAPATDARVTELEALLAGADSLPAQDQPAVLDFVATAAARAGVATVADAARVRLIDEFGQATETAAALLALARTREREPGNEEAARLLLEKLIVEHPRSALVPQARRELDRLLARVPGGGT